MKQKAWKGLAPGGARWGCLAVGWCPPGGDGAVMTLQALGAWQCVMLAKRSGLDSA